MSAVRMLGSLTQHGRAPDSPLDGQLLVVLPSLGTTTSVWDGVLASLRADPMLAGLRILSIDLPGHGVSPASGDAFTIDEMATAVLDVVDELGDRQFHIAGISLGGAIALDIAVRSPDRVLSLAMLCSGSRIGSSDGWQQRAAAVRASGTASLVTGSASRWFAPGYLDSDTGAGARALADIIDVDDESYARCAEALGDFDRTAEARSLPVPALLVSAEFDEVTTPDSMRELARTLPDAHAVEIAGASHLAALERPEEIASALAGHLAGAADPARSQTARRGDAVRRSVLSDAHVDAANAAITPETAAFQDFIGRYAWGEVWARPGLSRRDRSIATLASLVTAGHETELRMHLRAALRNGLTPDELSEILLHTALYAGLPAANAAFAVLREVLADTSQDGSN
ncbi:MAG: alpha/beta fold hydrolase [Mycetocola sp.]